MKMLPNLILVVHVGLIRQSNCFRLRHVLVVVKMAYNVGTPCTIGANEKYRMDIFKKDVQVNISKTLCDASKLKFFNLLKGIPRYKYTLSSIGGPCHFDYTLHSSLESHFSCAICVPNCHQCGPYTKVPLKKFSNGQYCTKGEAVRRCYGKSRLSHNLQLKGT